MKIIERIKNSIADKAGILFKSYPVTMGVTILITLLYSTCSVLEMADLPISSKQADTITDYIVLAAFALLLAWTWVLFVESIRYKFLNQKIYIFVIGTCVAAALATIAFFVCPKAIRSYEVSKIISGDMPYVYMWIRLVMYCLSAIAFIMAIYAMYKRSGVGFNEYWLSSLGESFKSFAAYMLLLIGAEVVVWIFVTLIADNDWMFAVVGILVSGLAFVPLLLVSFCDIKDRRSDGFIRGLVKYVLVPLATIAYLIVYVYIFKILIQRSLPSNEVFTILSIVFAVGMPIWTIASAYEDKGYMRIVRWMPYMFAPFIVLQIICLGLRISEHGITVSRYMGIVLILIEIIYLCMYVLSQVKKRELTEYIMPIVCVFIVTTYLVPGINVYSGVIRSQKKVIVQYMDRLNNGDTDSIPSSDMRKIKSSYSVIRDLDYGGKRYIDKHISKEAAEAISAYSSGTGDSGLSGYEYNIYINRYDDRAQVLDVEGYKKVYLIGYYDSDIISDHVNIRLGEDPEDVIELDLTDLLAALRDEYEENYSGEDIMTDSELIDDGYYSFPDGKVVYIEHLDYEKNSSSDRATLDMDGYLLVK